MKPDAKAAVQHVAPGPVEEGRVNRLQSVVSVPGGRTAEFERLKEDIRKNGIRVPVVVTPDGRILDGRSRVRACTELGIRYATRIASVDEVLDAPAFVLSMNAVRRHLSADQIVAIYLEAHALKVEADQKAAQAAQQANLKKGNVREPHMKPAGKTSDKIAKATGTSRSTVERVQKVKKHAPDRLLEVAQGTASAAGILKQELPEAQQNRAPADEAPKDPDTKQAAAKRSAKALKEQPTFLGARYGVGRRSIEKRIDRQLERANSVGKLLVQILADAKQVDHPDFPRWIDEAVARHVQIGAVLSRLQKEPCPTREELEVLLDPDEQQDAAAVTAEAAR